MVAQSPAIVIPSDRLVYSINRAAELLSLHPKTFWKLVYAKRIAAVRISEGRVGITRQALLDYIASCPSTEVQR